MPNLFNAKLHEIRRTVLARGIGAVDEHDFLAMVTIPAVRRYSDEPEIQCRFPNEIQVGTIGREFGDCEAEPDQAEIDDELECYL